MLRFRSKLKIINVISSDHILDNVNILLSRKKQLVYYKSHLFLIKDRTCRLVNKT